MATVNDILDFFEEFAPVDTAMEFDNVGLLVGNKDQYVRRALVALDITPEVVYEAERLECELIISHHPVIFAPLKKLESGTAQKTNKKNNQSVVSERPADHNAKRRTGSVNRKPWAMTEPSVQKLSFL